MSVVSTDAVRIPTGVGKKKTGRIVDGQQRATALSQLDPSRKLPVVERERRHPLFPITGS